MLKISDTAQPIEHAFTAVGGNATDSLVVFHVD
jgi:hypothetical protein